MRLTKQQREQVRMRFGGRCAYCGQPLGERWHTDHVEPVERKLAFVTGPDGVTRMRPTGEVRRPERDCIENLYPACAPCNIDKNSLSLESWRTKLQRATDVLRAHQPTYRHALRYGLVQETGARITFHFETVGDEGARETS